MKTTTLIFCFVSACAVTLADVPNPVAAFRQRFSGYPATEKLIKWECDINGDGLKEVFITAKTNYDEERSNVEAPGWSLYIANAAGTGYMYCEETHEGNTIRYSSVPIDTNLLFVGQISEINARGLVTIETANPRVGDSIARIYAYTIEDDHLKRTKLAEYNPEQPNAIFDKYLKDGKRAIIQPVEVTP